MYVNAKMTPVESVPGMGRGMKESNGGDEFKCYIFDTLLRTFVNAIMQPHPAQ
jgi:hypothetical protein